MVVKIEVSGFNEVEKVSFKKEKKGLLVVGNLIFNKVVEGERENVLMRLMGKFKGLRYEDLEEVYNDGCLVLWEKMMDKEFKLKEKSLVGYLFSICRNIGMHYLRKVNEDVMSLDRLMERGFQDVNEEENGLEELFDVMDEGGNDEEVFVRLESVWGKLKEVDRMILKSYYVDGCRMEEIAKKIGYRNGNSVKSKKNKVLKKMMCMMKEEGADKENPLPSDHHFSNTKTSLFYSDFTYLPVVA